MADYTKRPNGTYRVRYKDGSGKRASKTFKDVNSAKRFKAEVEIIEANMKCGLAVQLPQAPKRMTDLFEYWMQHRAVLKRKPADDESIIRRHLSPHFATLLVKNVSTETVDNFNGHLRKLGLSAKTISNILTLLGSLLRLAVELDWVLKTPKVKKPSTKEFAKDYGYFKSKEEIHKFLIAAKAEGQYVYTLYLTSLLTGMRLGELAGLTWDCIDFDRSLITVCKSFDGKTKNGETRYVTLQDENKGPLLEWRAKNPCTLVFPNKNNKMHSGSAWIFQDALKRVLARAGFPTRVVNGKIKHYLTFHGTRHSYASHWMMDGGKLHDLQHLLGHKQISQTQRYSHLDPEHLAKQSKHLQGIALLTDTNVIAFKRK